MQFVLIAIAVIIIILLVTNIHVVQQSRAFVVERLGGYHATWGVGLHVKVPILDRIAKRVSLKEQVVDFCSQPELCSVGESGRYIGIYTGCIYHAGEKRGAFRVFGDDTFAMS